jgi:hypothetical protein
MLVRKIGWALERGVHWRWSEGLYGSFEQQNIFLIREK